MKRDFKQNTIQVGRRKDLIYYILIMFFPIAQFTVFYVYVNINSVMLAFQKINFVEKTTIFTINNIKNAFTLMTTETTMVETALRSLYAWLLAFVIGTPLGLLFSYYIYKKLPLSNMFRVLLFMPSIISSIIMVMMFQYFVDRAVTFVLKSVFGDILNKNIVNDGLSSYKTTRFAVIMFYNIWISFGTSVLMYSNSMSGISQEIVESAHLDGANGFKEFIHITFPGVFPTLSTFIITGVAGIFTNQLNLFSFYGPGAYENTYTFGYYLYSKVLYASRPEYPLYSAMGILLTIIAVPMTLLVKWLLEKFGPSE